MISPYFIPSEQGLEVLGALVRRKVRVRILTNSLVSTDYFPLAHSGYARWRTRLLAAGIELHEMRPEHSTALPSERPDASRAYLHTKAIVIDRQRAVLGSMNLDPRSRVENTEVALFLESPALGARLGALLDAAVQPARAFRLTLEKTGEEQAVVWTTEEGGKEVRYASEPASWWRRFLSALLGAFAPERLL